MNVYNCPVKPCSLQPSKCMNHKKADVVIEVMLHPNCGLSYKTFMCYWWPVEKICHCQHGSFIRGEDTKRHEVLQSLPINDKKLTEFSRVFWEGWTNEILTQTLCELRNAPDRIVLSSPLLILGALVWKIRKSALETAGLLLFHLTLP